MLMKIVNIYTGERWVVREGDRGVAVEKEMTERWQGREEIAGEREKGK